MKKLTVALVLVALLTLPTMGLAGGPPSGNPPKGNDGLENVIGILLALGMATGNCWIALGFIDDLFSSGAPPTWWP